MLLLWLACADPAATAPTARDLARALTPAGWVRKACSVVQSEGVDTTACTFRREDDVAVVTVLVYERTADAARAWGATDAVGWRDGRLVIQVDVFDEDAARALLAEPSGRLPPGFSCEGGLCLRRDGDLRAIVGPSRPGTAAPGYVADGPRTAAVSDLHAARQVLARVAQR